MNNQSKQQSIRESVLGAIESGQVKMRPKWYFIARAAFLVTGGVLAALVLLFLASFVVFTLRLNGAWYVPAFGLRGVSTFIVALPWLILFVALGFLTLLEILIQRYQFAYKRPLLYSLAGLAMLLVAGGIVLMRIHLHETLFLRAQQHRLPLAGSLYRQYSLRQSRNFTTGRILKKTSTGFHLLNHQAETIEVVITPKTRLPLGADFAEDDVVVVFGQRQDGLVEALGVLEIDDEMRMLPMRGNVPRMK